MDETSAERIERQWAELHDVLEGRAPLVRSAAYVERSDRVFAKLETVAHCAGCGRGYVWLSRDGAPCLACKAPVNYAREEKA